MARYDCDRLILATTDRSAESAIWQRSAHRSRKPPQQVVGSGLTWVERLENAYKIFLGAALAFFVCYYVWTVEAASVAVMNASRIWVACYFWSRHLRKKLAATDGLL